MLTIITPVFNAQKYLNQCIQSVLDQAYSDWELIIVNDGSIDLSKDIILSYSDPRIRYFEQMNSGVSAARNFGLRNMKGNFFCFLDADDSLPSESLSSRMKVFFENPSIDFLDGIILKMNSSMSSVNYVKKPQFQGAPLHDLVRLTGKSFIALSWIIRRKENHDYRFKEGQSHGEDLLFFMELARSGGHYSFVNTPVLYYRDTEGSAMKNIDLLEQGYRNIEHEIDSWPELSSMDLLVYKYRWRKFMALDYLKLGKICKTVELFR